MLFGCFLLCLGGCAGSSSNNASNEEPAKTSLYFTGDSPTHFPALWKSDGTAAGTQLVKTFSTPPTNLLQLGDKVLFVADYPHSIVGVWQSDGTLDGTFTLKGPFARISSLVELNGNVYFLAGNFTQQSELWKINFQSHEATLIKIFDNPGYYGYLQKSGRNNLLLSIYYFDHNELWVSDGTTEGTRIFAATQSSADQLWWGPSAREGKAYFFKTINDGPLVVEASIWLSDGTEDGTTLVKSVSGEGVGLQLAEDLSDKLLVFISAQGQSAYWGVDKETAVAEKLPEIPTPTDQNSDTYYVTYYANVGRQFFFVVNKVDTAQKELWVTDGSVAGTRRLKNYPDSAVEQLAGADGRVFFMVWPGWPQTENAAQLWTSDGTVSGTSMVTDYTAEKFADSHYWTDKFLFFDGFYYYFHIFDYFFWRTDGTETGTAFIKNLAAP